MHSDDTVGTNTTTYNLTYGRDVAGLDVLGYTANDFNVTQARWDRAVELIHQLNRSGEFVCYPGTEWCGSSCAGGDHNVVFLRDGDPEFPFDRGRQCLPILRVERGHGLRHDRAGRLAPGRTVGHLHPRPGRAPADAARGRAPVHHGLASSGAGAAGGNRVGLGAFPLALRGDHAPRVQAGRFRQRGRAPRTLWRRCPGHRGVRHQGRGHGHPGAGTGPGRRGRRAPRPAHFCHHRGTHRGVYALRRCHPGG